MFKKAISGITAAVMIFSMCCINPTVSRAVSLIWDFKSSAEGWEANKGTLSVSDGIMTHTVAAGNNNAFLVSPNNLSIDGSKYTSVKIRLKNNNVKSSAVVVSFITTDDAAWDTSYSTGTKTVVTSGITGYDTDYQEYTVDMSDNEKWTNGIITRFRLLTALNSASITAGSMDIDYIKVTSVARDPVTYYVSSSATDGGDGSLETPWNELSDLDMADVQPGDTVLLERGSVFKESFAPAVYGNSSEWITLSAYGRGARPVIAPGKDSESRAAIMLDDIYGWKITQLEIKDARVGIEARNSTLSGHAPDGLWIEDCIIHDISGIVSPNSADDLVSGSDYINSMEDEGVYMSYGILLYKELGKGNKSFDNVTVKNCFISETDAPITITYANNTAIEDCVFANSRKAGVLLSNTCDNSAKETQASHMTGCKIYNMGYDGGMYYGVAGVQFNTCNYFTMSECDVFYTQIGGLKPENDDGSVPDGVGIDYEGANKNISVENCNVIGNMDTGLLVMQNQGWAAEKPNLNASIRNNYFANNRLRTFKADTYNAALMRVSSVAQAETSGEISGNTVIKRNGQSLISVSGGLSDDINVLAENYVYVIDDNTIIDTESDAEIILSVQDTPQTGESFDASLSTDGEIAAASTELYVDTDVYGMTDGLAESFDVTIQTGGKHMLMAKVTLEDGSVIYSMPVSLNMSGDIAPPDEEPTCEPEKDEIMYDWNFDVEGNVDSWIIPAAKGTLSQSGGNAVINIAAYNAAVMCPANIAFSGADYKYLHMIAKNDTGTANRHKIQWLTTDDQKWNTTTMFCDKTWEDAAGYEHYVYDMKEFADWNGKTITRIQINPAANATSGRVYIDRIAISNSAELPDNENVMMSGIDSIALYAEPFWESELMVNESITMINGSDGSPAEAPLMYAPTNIVSVRNSKLDKEYIEGEDYVVEGNTIKLTENTSIKAYNYTDVYPETAITDSRKRVSGGYVYCPEGDFFHNGQLAVTYYHEKDNDFSGIEYQGDRLPKLAAKLSAKDNVNVLLYGDSISSGANMSGMIGAKPWLPIYGELFCRTLSAKTGATVSFTNISKAGQTSEWGAENANDLISGKEPDVLIIAFGMNDATFGNTIDQFKTNINSIISTAKTLYPECEIMLVSTTIPNEDAYRADGTSLFIGNHRDQPAALKNIADEQGTAFVNMTAVHDNLLSVKRFVDMTGNNTNHPNDFLARCYVMSLMKAAVDDNYNPGEEPTQTPPTQEPTQTPTQAPVAEEYGARWSFTDTAVGWASNKGAKQGSRTLYINNGTLEYYLSDNTAESANTNNFVQSPGNLSIDGGKYKYVKIRVRSEMPVAGDLGIQFTTSEKTTFPALWSDSEQTVLEAGAVTANDTEFKEYIVDMSRLPAWADGTITRIRIRLNPATIAEGDSGLVHIASITVSDSDKASVAKNDIKYDWDFENVGSVDSWIMSEAKGTISQSDGNAVVDIAASNASVMCPANIEFYGAEYPYIHIVSKNDTGAANYQKIQWLTSDDKTWNTDTMYLTKTWDDVDGYVHYVYDMSEIHSWRDRTITRFSIYPTAGAASGKVYIDRIMISGMPSILYDDNTITFSKDIANRVACKAAVRLPENCDVKLIVAFYDEDGTLKKIESKDVSAERNIQTMTEVSVDVVDDYAYVKAFVWRSLDNIIPICKSEIQYIGAEHTQTTE